MRLDLQSHLSGVNIEDIRKDYFGPVEVDISSLKGIGRTCGHLFVKGVYAIINMDYLLGYFSDRLFRFKRREKPSSRRYKRVKLVRTSKFQWPTGINEYELMEELDAKN